MRLYPFYSSSKGNCALLVHREQGLLIDCGVPYKQIRLALSEAGISLDALQGILLTHEHSDHIKGLALLEKNTHLPVFASRGTLFAAEVDGIDHQGEPFDAGGFHIIPIKTSHDAADPCGYRIECEGKAVGIVTDTGKVTPEMLQALRGCSLIMLESNYDPSMLENGPYAASLKRRVRSEKGHLSNGDCASLLALLAMEGDLKTAVLAHISPNNNTPLTAKMAAMEAFAQYGIEGVLVEAGGPFCPPLEVE